jgi:hypothetical protein
MAKYIICRAGVIGVLGLAGSTLAGIPNPLPTGPDDFFEYGTQPNTLLDPMMTYDDLCKFCHAGYDPAIQQEPGRWRGSMHAHAGKDPIFLAAVAIANQDAPGSGSLCWKCHTPSGWVEGRATPADGSSLLESDFREGISCHLCHRMVDPSPDPGNPPTTAQFDAQILSDLGSLVPFSPGNGQYVIDPLDYRRGPFDLGPGFFYHAFLHSPFHKRGEMCGTCHNVSNPVLKRLPGPNNGVYVPDEGTPGDPKSIFNTPHSTGDTNDMFPEQRTYSEWAASTFAATGVDMAGRFGGNLAVVSQCQDCHQPDINGGACIPGLGPTQRTDLPYHSFAGANRWMIDVILHQYTGTPLLDQPAIDALNVAKGDVEYMLLNASDMTLTQTGADLNVRIINQCAHKLLTGMPEGRRMWINVVFKNAKGAVLAERGAYDPKAAVLNEAGTKVYECVFGIDALMSSVTGLPVGPSFHLVLNNAFFKDNRIPPRGFSNAVFDEFGGSPVEYSYADGQYWDDTGYFIPAGAATAEVKFYYQIASREYIEFLRDANQETPPNDGTRVYDAWVATGKSPPFEMDSLTLNLVPYLPSDFNGDGSVNGADLSVLLSNFGSQDARPLEGDANGDGRVDGADLSVLLSNFGTSI